MTRIIPALAALGAATFILAGCSSSPAADSNDAEATKSIIDSNSTVFDFPLNAGQPSSDVTVSVPDNLREAIGTEADSLLVESIRLTPHKLDGIKLCAVDFAVTYADGGFDVISKPADGDAIAKKTVESLKRRLASGVGVETFEQVPAALDKIEASDISIGSKRVLIERDPVLGKLTAEFGNLYVEGDSWESFLDRLFTTADKSYRENNAKEYDKPQEQLVSSGLGFSTPGEPMSELDDAAPKKGTYISEDGAKVTSVSTCASSSIDPEASVDFRLPMRGEGDRIATFADNSVAVMTDGTLGVAGEIDDYRRDAKSNWIVR